MIKKKTVIALSVFFVITVCLFASKLLLFKNSQFFAFNHAVLKVSSASMQPEYPVNSLVIIKKVRFNSLKQNDVIAFKSRAMGGKLALHRISRVAEDGYYTKGDNNDYEDNQLITAGEFVGKAVYRVTFFAGYLTAIGTFGGFLLFLLLPLSAVVIVYVCVKRIARRGEKA